MDSRKVYWSQGLFLAPQHFQQQDLYHEERSFELSGLTRGSFWGVARLAVDQAILQSCRLAIDDLEMLTPRGALIRAGRNAERPNAFLSETSFASAFDQLEQGEKLDAYLVLTPHNPHGRNVTDPEEADLTHARYVIAPAQQSDHYTPDDNERADVSYVNYALSLRFAADGEAGGGLDDRETVRIARIGRSLDGTPELDLGYIPPSLSIHAVPALREKVTRALASIEGRALNHAKTTREHGFASTTLSVQNIWNTLTLTTVNRLAADLRSAYEDERCHPAEAYAILRRAVAVLSSFSIEHDLFGRTPEQDSDGGLPRYDHSRIGPQFDAAVKLIEHLLTYLNPGPEFMRVLEYDAERKRYAAELPQSFFEGRAPQYFLLVRSQIADTEELRRQLNEAGKLADPQNMEEVVRRSLTALPVRRIDMPPPELIQMAQKFRIFAIGLEDDKQGFWREVERQGQIELHSPNLDSSETEVRIAKIAVED